MVIENTGFFHGLALYCSEGPFASLSLQERVDNLVRNNIEIACSEVPLGPVGVIVDGLISRAFPYDCQSTIDRASGNRIAGPEWIDYQCPVNDITNKNEVIDWLRDLRINHKAHNERSYGEIFLNPHSIYGVWIKHYVSNEVKSIMQQVADQYRVPVVNVSRYTYVWELNEDQTMIGQEDYDYDDYVW